MTVVLRPETDLPDLPSPSSLVNVRIDDMIVDRRLKYPVYDTQGLLLLAGGTVITAEFKRHLKSREVSAVDIDYRDAENVTLSTDNLVEFGIPRDLSAFDTEVTKKLDKIVDAGLLFVQNRGPAVKESLVFHGRGAYAPKQRANLLNRHRSSCESLDCMMREVVQGGRVDGSTIAGIAGSYLGSLTSDSDALMSVAAEAKADATLSNDSLKTALFGMAIGVEMGLDADNVRSIGLIGLVQNWGMIRVPREIRELNRKLTSVEFLEINKHPIYTLEMLESVSGFSGIVPLVAYQMHERVNGRGYPRGRRGYSIHLFARILQAADAYTAMTERRSYRQPMMPYTAISALLSHTRIKTFDPTVIRALLKILSLFPIGSLVMLDDGRLATVMRRNGDNYVQPIVRILQNADGNTLDPLDPDNIVNLEEANLRVRQAIPMPGRNELAEDVRPVPTCM